MPSVRLKRMNVPRDSPDGTFDLIVLSEVVYYLDEEGVALSLGALRRHSSGRRRPPRALDGPDQLSVIRRSCRRAPHREDLPPLPRSLSRRERRSSGSISSGEANSRLRFATTTVARPMNSGSSCGWRLAASEGGTSSFPRARQISPKLARPHISRAPSPRERPRLKQVSSDPRHGAAATGHATRLA